jgi:hypothetical protein
VVALVICVIRPSAIVEHMVSGLGDAQSALTKQCRCT